ncbi:MAG: hypothetical protein RR369_01515 [Lachnospiraceae bacterium]
MRRQTNRHHQEGSALIPVLCILCAFMTFVLAMILTSYQVLNRAQRSATKEQCRLSAITFSQELEKVLEEDHPEDEQKLNGLQTYIWEQVTTNWPYYNAEEEGHKDKKTVSRPLELKIIPDITPQSGQLKATMYWEFDNASAEKAMFQNAVLVVKVTSTLRNQSYTVTTQYELQKPPNEEKIDKTKPVYWKWAHSWRGI